MNKPMTLTKFTKFYSNIFTGNGGLKISLPQEFNDLFDNQIRFSDIELQELSLKYNLGIDQIKYYSERLQTVHILSLIGRSALNFDTSHMWGLYSDNGRGIALEFDFNEVEERMNFTSLKKLTVEFRKKFTIEQIQHRDSGILEYFHDNFNDSALASLDATIKSMPKSGNDNEMVKFESKLSSYNITQALADVDFILTIATLLIDENKVSSILNTSDYLSEVKYHSDYTFIANIFEQYLSLSSLSEITKDQQFTKLNNHLENSLASYVPQYHPNHPITNDIKKVMNFFISGTNVVKRNLQRKQVQEFQSNKALLWQNESEWRMMIMEFCLPIISESDNIALKNGFNKGKDNLISERKKLNIKTLAFSKSHHISHIELKKQLIAVPLLPLPKRIILGWDFDIYTSNKQPYVIKSYHDRFGIKRSLRCNNQNTNFVVIKNFCSQNGISLVKLKKSVDYKNAEFEYTEIL